MAVPALTKARLARGTHARASLVRIIAQQLNIATVVSRGKVRQSGRSMATTGAASPTSTWLLCGALRHQRPPRLAAPPA